MKNRRPAGLSRSAWPYLLLDGRFVRLLTPLNDDIGVAGAIGLGGEVLSAHNFENEQIGGQYGPGRTWLGRDTY